ncbi:MAG: hypothetical protein Q9N32_01115 [Gammaproteobacteria bacterium]|nr:hypothetical protein [Gammaproteobacteria bacterium]
MTFISLYLPGTNRSLKEFIIEVQNNHGAWQRLFSSQSLPTPYNFAKSNAGGIRAVVPSSSTWSPSKINDGASNIRWDRQNWLSRPGTMNNTFEFTFDPDLNGTPGEVSDQFYS